MRMRAGAAALVAAALAVAPALVGATEPPTVSWTVSPATAEAPDGRSWVERTADAGEAYTEYLALRNVGAEPAVFRLSAADGYFTEAGRFSMLQAGEASTGAGRWISIAPEVAVEPGATAIVPFTVAVPPDAEPGDHAAGVAASVLRDGVTADGTRVGVESRIGFRVITRVEGEIAPAVAVEDLEATFAGTWDLFAPGVLSVAYTAANTGNTALRVGDRIDGAAADRGELLPGERRRVVVDPVRRWPLGAIDVTVRLAADQADGAEVAPSTATVTVWAVPWAHLSALAAAVGALALLLAARRRSRLRVARLIERARAEGRREAEA